MGINDIRTVPEGRRWRKLTKFSLFVWERGGGDSNHLVLYLAIIKLLCTLLVS
jgi:hypothetical protein